MGLGLPTYGIARGRRGSAKLNRDILALVTLVIGRNVLIDARLQS